jgi:CheY-like chemotaxis protein
MDRERTKSEEVLQDLQKEAKIGPLNRDCILVVEKGDEPRKIIKEALISDFPHYEIEFANDEALAIDEISRRLALKVSLIIGADQLLVRDKKDGLAGLSLPSNMDFSKVPIVATRRSSPHEDQRLIDSLDEGGIDGFFDKGSSTVNLRSCVLSSVQRRAQTLQQIESAAKSEVLGAFVHRYMTELPAMKASLEGLTFYDSQLDDLQSCLSETLSILQNIAKDCELGEIPHEKLRVYIHDINNKLSVLIYTPDFILEDFPDMSDIDRSGLETFTESVANFNAYIQNIRTAYSANGSWARLETKIKEAKTAEKLTLPESLKSICVVDDDPEIVNLIKKLIEHGNPKASIFWARNGEDLSYVSKETKGEGIDFILLDNNLGPAGFGHELIEIIRKNWPDAILVAHTSDAETLSRDPQNPYTQAGIEIADKRAWEKISEIVFNQLGDKSQKQ